MNRGMFRGKSVVFVDSDDITFWREIFFMLEAYAGCSCCMSTDPVLSSHFKVILSRFKELACTDDFDEIVTIGLK